MVEFKHKIPTVVEQLGLPYRLPSVAHMSFLSAVDSPAQLNICDSASFVSFFQHHGTFPPVDVIVLDEYHLNSRPHLVARLLLTHLLPSAHPPQVVLVSATPPDRPPPPVRMDGLTVNTMPIPDPLANPLPPIYLRKNLGKYGNDTLLVIADSCVTAHGLAEQIQAAGENAATLCPCITPERTADYFRSYLSDITFVATPDTEAGLTVDCAYMVNPGTVLRVNFQNGVLYPGVFQLGPRQAVQRLGRAGRLRHTVVFTSPGSADPTDDTPSPVLAGEAYLHILAATGAHPDSPDAVFANRAFPRLAQCTQALAIKAVRAPTPVLAIYRHSSTGELFTEFGGSHGGFVEECGPLLRLFTWPGGRAFAPYVDLTAPHDPSSGQTLQSLKSLSNALFSAKPALAGRLDINQALVYAAREPEAFASAIWLALKELEGPPNLTVHDSSPHSSRSRPDYMFGQVGFRAWMVLAALGASVNVSFIDTNGTVDRRPTFRGDSFSYSSARILNDSGKVDDELVTQLLLPHLRPVAITYLLQDDPDLSTDLRSFRHCRQRSGNPWFRNLKL